MRKNKGKRVIVAFICVLLILVLGGLGFSSFRSCINNSGEEIPGNTDEWVDGDEEFEDGTTPGVTGVFLNESLANATGAQTITIKGDNTIEPASTGNTLLGAETVDSITIMGEEGATIRAIGEGAGRIQANGNGTLIIKNVTIIDETPHKGTYYHEYLAWGGNLVFENCEFKQSIKILGDNATFKNCIFNSPWTKYYSVWVSNGVSKFDTCLFMGYRALKIHEYEQYDQDILSVEVDGCTFNNISEKPGVVIGKFPVNPKQTTVSVKNSIFLSNHAWDNVGCLEGVNGFYESDNPTSEFVFITENNTVNYTAKIYAINYYTVENGEVVAIPDYMWKANVEYPTSYESGTTVTIESLVLTYAISGTEDREFLGWYLDKDYTQKFDGTIDTSQAGDIVLYAKIIKGSWTKNY